MSKPKRRVVRDVGDGSRIVLEGGRIVQHLPGKAATKAPEADWMHRGDAKALEAQAAKNRESLDTVSRAWRAGQKNGVFAAPSADTQCAPEEHETNEVQKHGKTVEYWVCDNFFGGYRNPEHTALWDIPAEVNQAPLSELPEEFHNLPISVKAPKNGSPLYLADASRQISINEPFVLAAAVWHQDGMDKVYHPIELVTIQPETWRAMWGTITPEMVEELNQIVKNPDVTYKEARKAAKRWLAERKTLLAGNDIQLNPKINADVKGKKGHPPKKKRRLQCTLSYAAYYRLLQERPTLLGKTLPRHYSPPRYGESADT